MKTREEKLKCAVNEYVDKNLSAVDNWTTLGEDQISHIKNIAISIVFDREGIMHGGHFVKAVLNNDLENALFRADSVCERALKLFIYVKKFVYIQ